MRTYLCYSSVSVPYGRRWAGLRNGHAAILPAPPEVVGIPAAIALALILLLVIRCGRGERERGRSRPLPDLIAEDDGGGLASIEHGHNSIVEGRPVGRVAERVVVRSGRSDEVHDSLYVAHHPAT